MVGLLDNLPRKILSEYAPKFGRPGKKSCMPHSDNVGLFQYTSNGGPVATPLRAKAFFALSNYIFRTEKELELWKRALVLSC